MDIEPGFGPINWPTKETITVYCSSKVFHVSTGWAPAEQGGGVIHSVLDNNWLGIHKIANASITDSQHWDADNNRLRTYPFGYSNFASYTSPHYTCAPLLSETQFCSDYPHNSTSYPDVNNIPDTVTYATVRLNLRWVEDFLAKKREDDSTISLKAAGVIVADVDDTLFKPKVRVTLVRSDEFTSWANRHKFIQPPIVSDDEPSQNQFERWFKRESGFGPLCPCSTDLNAAGIVYDKFFTLADYSQYDGFNVDLYKKPAVSSSYLSNGLVALMSLYDSNYYINEMASLALPAFSDQSLIYKDPLFGIGCSLSVSVEYHFSS